MDIYAHADGSRECRPLNEIAPDRSNERLPDDTKPRTDRVQSEDLSRLPDHAEAFRAWLLENVKLIDAGQAVHEVAGDMVLPVRFAARRI
jgi:hypothetical protein